MKLELSIADDRELRNFIKDSIKGEVTSIARGEIKGIIADVTKEGIVPSKTEDIEKIIRSVIQEEVRKELKISWSSSELIQKIAREEIQLVIKKLVTDGKLLS